MAKFKNIRIKKRGGGTRMQRVKVLASGKFKFVKNLTSRRKSKPLNTRSSRNKPRRRTARNVAGKRSKVAKDRKGFLSRIDSRVKHYGFGLLYGGVVQEPTEQLTQRFVASRFGQFFNLTDDAARPLIIGFIEKMFTDGRGPTSQFLKAALTAEGANTGRKAVQAGGGLLGNFFN